MQYTQVANVKKIIILEMVNHAIVSTESKTTRCMYDNKKPFQQVSTFFRPQPLWDSFQQIIGAQESLVEALVTNFRSTPAKSRQENIFHTFFHVGNA